MGIFDRVEQQQLDQLKGEILTRISKINEDLNQYKNLTKNQIAEIQHEVRTSASVSAETAQDAAIKAVESQNNIKTIETSFSSAFNDINLLKQELIKEKSELASVKTEVTSHKDEIAALLTQAKQNLVEVVQKKTDIDKASVTIAKQITDFNTYLEQSKKLPASLQETTTLLAECKKFSDNIQTLLDNAIKKKTEIDEIHKKVYGEEISSSDGKISRVPGLKDELETSYSNLSENFDVLESRSQEIVADIRSQFEKSSKENQDQFEIFLTASQGRFDAVDKELTGLLPGAMAAGLSAAYEEKKNDEIKALDSFNITFRWAIAGLVGISSIPLMIDIYLVAWKSVDLVKVLKDTPTLLFAIMPLYFPILWLAYSSNKKANLSKRLIEEYTHKSVLGKTFSGLSNQIETLQDQGFVKEELRTKLLFNVLQVSAENPGKLITNYSKSDHPLMDALENSVKLADSVSALSKIPGFSALAGKLAEKADDLLTENAKKVEAGLSTQEVMESTVKAAK